MVELLRSNDLVLLSFIEALLAEAGVPSQVFDGGMSAAEGLIGAFPRRVMIHADDLDRARALVEEAGEGRLLPAREKIASPWSRR